MNNEPRDSEENKPLRIRRGRVESVEIYEIKDAELDTLERGSPADIQFNFGIFLASLAFAAIATLCTATSFRHSFFETLFLIISVVGVLGGAYLGISWYRSRTSLKGLCKRIRSRIPPEPMSDHLPLPINQEES